MTSPSASSFEVNQRVVETNWQVPPSVLALALGAALAGAAALGTTAAPTSLLLDYTAGSVSVAQTVAQVSARDIVSELSRIHDLLLRRSVELPPEARDLLFAHLEELYL